MPSARPCRFSQAWCCIHSPADLLPDWRADHSAVLNSLEHTGQPYALLDTESDRLTNAVNTLSEEVFRWSVPSGPA
jgi:hypothetical protein